VNIYVMDIASQILGDAEFPPCATRILLHARTPPVHHQVESTVTKCGVSQNSKLINTGCVLNSLTVTKICIFYTVLITFFKRGPADPSQQCKRASNSIHDPQPRWILTIFKLKFGGGNLFSSAMTCTIEGNNYVGSLLKPLFKKVTPVVGSRMLCICSVKL
jgi:hypothetical protein